jgi:DNA polymerase-1
MKAIRPRTKKQALFIKLKLEYQHLNKRMSTYYKIYLEALENNNSIVHGKLNQAVAGTHRRTASSPNLQNQPRELKRCFNARYDGWLFGQDDYTQLEYRAAGFLARCPVALRDIEEKVDAHTLTASMIFDGEVTKETRTDAKSHTFKPLYGGMSGSEKEKTYYQWFIDKHTGIKQWHKKLLNEVTIYGYVTTLTGMKFYFPHAGYDKNGYFKEQTKIKNYPVQYFATGEITPIGILHFWHILKAAKLQSFLVGEVHDSALSEIHPDETEVVAQAAQEGMVCWALKYLDKLYGICYDYHLEIEHEASEYWGT